ncbi:MAG: helicase-related protein [Candidatus Binataceae bacterium]|jgi:superfamily II DNA or RNA helicase/HKD family nuclease
MPRRSSSTGSELFIVDNSDDDWKVLRYLHDWCQISKSIDIATGYFEIGALLALKDEWQKVDQIRILMGDEVSRRTKAAFTAGLQKLKQRLDLSLETEKEKNDFLTGVPGIVEAIRSGKIACRVYRKDKFHAKAYITHARLEVVGSSALVGSANFTYPGLTENIELNVQITGQPVAVLQEWYEEHWAEAEDVSAEILKTIERHTQEYLPFDVYTKALHEFFRGHEMTASEWEETRSKMFSKLDRYQKEAYWALMKIARHHAGAFLCDGVGLGKTFVGLMLIERLILHEGKRVVLFAPKAAKEAVWEPHLRDWLAHIGGVSGGADFSNLAVFSHTDLNRKGDFPARFRRITELADVVLIDEAHHFRNPGRQGDSNGEDDDRSRYYRLYDLLEGSVRPKTLFMLTATPINNRLSDFRHMTELFSRRDEAYFARTLGVNNLRAHFNNMEKALRKRLGGDGLDLGESPTEVQETLTGDEIFQHLVVQRSRAYARESQIRENRTAAVFPERKPPIVADYSIRQTYGRLLDLLEKAFERKSPLFTLPIYYPLAYYKGDDKSIDPFEENRQKQVVGLIRTGFLKRFESSVAAFELSCDRLMRKLLAFLEVHSETSAEKNRLERWKHQNAEVLNYVAHRQSELWKDADDEDQDEDIIPQEFLESVTKLSRDEYEVVEMLQETFLDLDQIVSFLEEAKKFEPRHDDKLKKLIRLLKSRELETEKVLIFTEFADTARYLFQQLTEAGIEGVAQVDSATKGNRADILQRFSPYYNGTNSAKLREQGKEEIRVLLSTDVLSEGLNLQDASRMINYDIHWNPVRLMQRIGRVDRRMNPAIEEALIQDHPEVAASRGKVSFWNFLPPDELNVLLTLYTKVTQKTLMISKTLGIEGKKLFTPEDDYAALKEFNHAYEGTKTVIEEMHLEYQALTQDHPELAERLNGLPGAFFSGRKRPAKGTRGVFFCYALPALDKETNEFTEAAGTTRWYLYDMGKSTILEEPGEIIESLRCKPNTARRCLTEEKTLKDIRASVLKHIKDTYLKRVDAPVGVKPALKCWMEINEG